MLLTIEALPAAEGDCLLVHWGTTAAEPKLAVIDGGPGRTWDDQLLPRLTDIARNRGLSQLPVALVLVSHVDNDHVTGILKMFRFLKYEIETHVPMSRRLLSVARLWHNAFNDILNDEPDDYYETFTASYTASTGAGPAPGLVDRVEQELRARNAGDAGYRAEDAAHDAFDIVKLLAGHGEGRDLRVAHRYLFQKRQTRKLNDPFEGLIVANPSTTVEQLDLHVVGPQTAEISALQSAFDDYIKAKGLAADAVLAAYSDRSIPNLSSIVCLASFGGRKLLLTGDARGDKILAGLAAAGLLTPEAPLTLDVLKVPHHGSDNNVERKFFAAISAEHYIFSGNGKHGNPERETLEMLIDARTAQDVYHLHFTYTLNAIDARRQAEVESRGRAWNPNTQSLKVLLCTRSSQGYRFVVHEGPVKIELGDESL